MKLLRVTLKNLNSFKDVVDLDFTGEPLGTAPLLAITGPTGSGKTTLLDAFSVALFNKTPRLSGKENRSPVNLLRQGENEGFSEVVFAAGDARYRARWEAKKNKKGEIKDTVSLYNLDEDRLITTRKKSAGTRELSDMSVEDAVSRALGLDFAAFNRSTMLAQGEFAAFLKADPEKKRRILQVTTGTDIYEKLKLILNEKVKSVTQACESEENALGMLEPVSEEDIRMLQEQIQALDAEIETLKKAREEAGEKKLQELKRVEYKKQLDALEERLRELVAKRDGIEKITSEVNRAERAERMRPEQNAWKLRAGELEKAGLARLETEKGLEVDEQELGKKKTLFECADKELQEMKLRARDMTVQIDEALKEEIAAAEREKQVLEKRREAERCRSELLSIQKERKGKESALRELIRRIEQDQAFIRENPLPDDSAAFLTGASVQLNLLKGLREKSAEIQKERNALEAQLEGLEKKGSGLQRHRKELVKKREGDEKLHREAAEKLEASRGRGDVEYWEREKEKAQRVQADVSEYEHCARDLSRLEKELRSCSDELESLGDELAGTVERLNEIRRRMEESEKNVMLLREKRDLSLLGNQVASIRLHLKEGEPCPVCGSTEHPLAGSELVVEDDAVKRLEEAERGLAELQKQWNALEKARFGKEERQKSLAGTRDKTGGEIGGVKEKSEECKKKWQEVFPGTASLSGNEVKEKIHEADRRIGEMVKLREREQQLRSSLELLGEKIGHRDREIEENRLQREEKEHRLQEKREQALKVEQELASRGGQFRESIPERFLMDDPEESLSRFSSCIKAVQTCREGLEKNRATLGKLEAENEGMGRSLAEKGASLAALESQVENGERDARVLLKSAREKTGGLRAGEARQKLKQELDELEKARAGREGEYQEQQRRKSSSEARAKEAGARLEERMKECEEARRHYLNVLEAAGFESPETHQEAFREPAFLKEARNEIENYHRELHSVNEQIAEKRAFFEPKPFEPGALEEIQKNEQELEESVSMKRRQDGELREKLKQKGDSLKRILEQQKSLSAARKERDRWKKLQDCIPHNRLEDFALKSIFELLISLANRQLYEITRRYELVSGDSMDLMVIDRWNAGAERPVETLSGGESFLTSLSLALALSEMSRGRTKIDSLFLDEGFGTLDADTLDVVLSALEKLHFAGTRITLISHIQELTDRIPTRIVVRKQGDGSSEVEIMG